MLDRRTGNRSERTENAAIAGVGLEHFAAALAGVKVPAGVGRHALDFAMAACGAGQCRAQFHGQLAVTRAGYPASVEAAAMASVEARAG